MKMPIWLNLSVTTIVCYSLALFGVFYPIHASAQDAPRQTITLVHFSDYHSNALPAIDEEGNSIGGIARALHYLSSKDKPNTLIFSGGDMMNKGAPAWSDKYRCAEWSWFNGVLDAMALGNHDADYGAPILAHCASQLTFPLLSANTLTKNGKPAFTHEGNNYAVFELDHIKVGVFALAGNDFSSLIKADRLPVPEARFADRIKTAGTVVATLRQLEKVDLVILIGHAHYEEDLGIAQEVAGIDLIFGSHSHRQQSLMQIPNTQTWFISAGQYLSHIAEVTLQFAFGLGGKAKIESVEGQLVAMDQAINEDVDIAQRVAEMQTALEQDPLFAAQFKTIGFLPKPLTAPSAFKFDSVLGNFVSDTVRDATNSDVAIFTSSTFRKSIPKGEIREHHLTDALPYDNKLYIYSLSGDQIRALIDVSIGRRGSDFFSQVSGLKIAISDDGEAEIHARQDSRWAPLQPGARYQVVTSDYQAKVAVGYKTILSKLSFQLHQQSLRDVAREGLKNSTIVTETDGRIFAN